jgi:hypothetical protein
MKFKITQRGFKYFQFQDDCGQDCVLQSSSASGAPKIWLGLNKVVPLVEKEGKGLIPIDLPKEVVINGRMHLGIPEIKRILPALLWLVENEDYLDNCPDELDDIGTISTQYVGGIIKNKCI